MIGTHNDGHVSFYKHVLGGLGINTTAIILTLFEQLDLFKTNRKSYQSSFECKRVRAHGYAAQQKSEVAKQRSEGPSYVTNLQVNKLYTRGQSSK